MVTRKRLPTISDIKYDTQVASPYFFDRKSMRFFGQAMRDFKVRRSPRNRIFIFAKGSHGYTFRQYVSGKLMGHGKLLNVPGWQRTVSEVEDYIRRH